MTIVRTDLISNVNLGFPCFEVLFTTDEAAAPYDPASDECSDECEAGLDCHMRRFMTSIDAAAEASGQSLAAIKVGTQERLIGSLAITTRCVQCHLDCSSPRIDSNSQSRLALAAREPRRLAGSK